MDFLLAGLLLVVIVALLLLLAQARRGKDPLLTQELGDLKNQLNDLRTRQLQAQAEALVRQSDLFNQTQKMISGQLTAILNSVSENLTKTQGNIIAQLSHTGTVVQDVQKKLGALEETTRQLREIGQDISSLQDILRAPKLRGNLGEYLLEDLLRQIFPAENFQMKYSFKSGQQVDAVIRLGQGLIPVDAKFPLESFQRLVAAGSEEEKRGCKREFIRSVKERIDEIADRYIKPDEGTYDFALIYIPAENVFYETVITDSLTEKNYEIFNYGIQRHVIPVSPNSFYAYLMAIAYGLKGFKIEHRAKVILDELSKLQDNFSKFYSDFALVGKHLNNASSKYEECLKKADRFDDKLGQITSITGELRDKGTEALDKPG